jgi:hypothetical protein
MDKPGVAYHSNQQADQSTDNNHYNNQVHKYVTLAVLQFKYFQFTTHNENRQDFYRTPYLLTNMTSGHKLKGDEVFPYGKNICEKI